MEQLFNELIEAAKNNRKGLIRLKNAVVHCGQYELAAKIRAIEVEAFPETDEVKQAKEAAQKLGLLFRMVDLNIDSGTCWLIAETLKAFIEKKGEFTIEDAIELRQKKDTIFPEADH